MDYQFLAAIGVLVVALGYLLFVGLRGWRRIRQGQCSSSCGCPSRPKTETPGMINGSELTRRLHEKRHA